MDNSQHPPASARSWLPPRAFWIWTAINAPSFAICFFPLAGILWLCGKQYFVPLYPVPPNDYLVLHAEEFARVQLLFAFIPALICITVIVGITLWRRKLMYALGAILGLLLSTYQAYAAEIHADFYSPGAHLHLLAVLAHWSHLMR
jgi:hypothetical protein